MPKIKIVYIIGIVALIFLGTFLFSHCKSKATVASSTSWKTQVIKEGKHAAKPYKWFYGKLPSMSITYQTDESWVYFHNQDSSFLGDQKDWNKLFGQSLHLFTSHKNSWMGSWRFNPKDTLIEIGIYTHQDGERKILSHPSKVKLNLPPVESQVFSRIRPGQEFTVYFTQVDPWTVSAQVSNGKHVLAPVQISFKRKIKHIRLINNWFGGNLPAKQDIKILYSFTKKS